MLIVDAILRKKDGPDIVRDMMTELGKDGFCTASNNGLWAILRTKDGRKLCVKVPKTGRP
jgi:hypothetical protein